MSPYWLFINWYLPSFAGDTICYYSNIPRNPNKHLYTLFNPLLYIYKNSIKYYTLKKVSQIIVSKKNHNREASSQLAKALTAVNFGAIPGTDLFLLILPCSPCSPCSSATVYKPVYDMHLLSNTLSDGEAEVRCSANSFTLRFVAVGVTDAYLLCKETP